MELESTVSMTMKDEQPGRGDMASSAEFNFWCALNDLPFRLSLNEWPDGGREWDVDVVDETGSHAATAYGTGQTDEIDAVMLAQAFIAGVEWASIDAVDDAVDDAAEEEVEEDAEEPAPEGASEEESDDAPVADTVTDTVTGAVTGDPAEREAGEDNETAPDSEIMSGTVPGTESVAATDSDDNGDSDDTNGETDSEAHGVVIHRPLPMPPPVLDASPEDEAEPDPGPGLGTGMSGTDYVRPDATLLQVPGDTGIPTVDESTLAQNARSLETVLSNFRVRGEIMDVRPGPVITLYEFEPRPGTKSSTVINLADDIARSMSAVTARIAVVPGRSVIGVELPNPVRETVFLAEIVGSDAYRQSKTRLPLALGKDIGGQPVVMDLATMPHLLIAGTTGSGKSVGINTMILSLLFRHTPDQCRLIMIDPKMLELSIYDGIPHLLTPVVTDPKKAVVALRWAVREMESRYKMMSALGVRNIDTYNRKVAGLKARGEMIHRQVQVGFDKESRQPIMEDHEVDPVELPYIVIVVDEMADLMLMAGKDIEAVIQRLAQMARAAGIHLIMATQRPSVDVITGTIKANFPTRISFQVTSKIDSRTILGEAGAEQLLGQGDMLSLAPGGRITRVHGAFVADAEVESIADYLRAQGEPEYMHTITEEDGEDVWESTAAGMDMGEGDGSSGDDLYDRAVAVVRRENKVSVSFIQRHLQIGYNRAATLVEKMETDGLIGPANHVGKREILLNRADR